MTVFPVQYDSGIHHCISYVAINREGFSDSNSVHCRGSVAQQSVVQSGLLSLVGPIYSLLQYSLYHSRQSIACSHQALDV